MEYEFETEKTVRDFMLDTILEEVRDRLRQERGLPETFYVEGQSIYTGDLAEDEGRFDLQEWELASTHDKPLVAQIRSNAWPHEGEYLPVVVDLYGVHQDYDVEEARITLRDAGLKVEHVETAQAREIFADRVAETIALRTAEPGGPGSTGHLPYGGGMDTVSSRYDGDPIICAKGWFLSTRTIIGQSSCALDVPPARYSLGVVHHGRPIFYPELWSLPAGRHIYLPLP